MSFYKPSATCQIPDLGDKFEELFGQRVQGTFVEVGGYDGERFSNTSCLADLGWLGIYIEPNPLAAVSCMFRHASNNVRVIPCAAGPRFEMVNLYLGDTLTTTNLQQVEVYQQVSWAKGHHTSAPIPVPQIRLDRILEKFRMPADFDLLVVDVEGAESAVFDGLDTKWLPKVMIVELEDDHPDLSNFPALHDRAVALRQRIVSRGYREFWRDAINTIFVRTGSTSVASGLPFIAIDEVFGTAGPKVIAEIGAADGLDTIAYAQRYPRATIHAFEPLRRNVEAINNIVTAFALAQVCVHAIALGDHNKVSADFWESRGTPLHHPRNDPWPYSSSLLPPKDHLDVHAWCTFEKTTTSVCRFEDYTRVEPDYVHIDVQGAELAVLRGFGERLKTVRAVWMEVSSVELYAGQPLYDEVNRFMREAGFELVFDTAAGKISGDQFWRR